MHRKKSKTGTVKVTSFKRLVIISNPVSTRANEIKQKFLDALPSTIETVLEITTEPTYKKTAEKLRSELSPGDVLVVAGGDGTVNAVVRTLVDEKTESNIQKTPITPLPAGNANDFANMLKEHPHDMDHALKGKPVAIHPISCTVTTSSGKPQTYIAASYISFGVTARAAHYLSEEFRDHALRKYPVSRDISNFMAISKAYKEAGLFGIEIGGKRHRIYDVTISNGDRMARVGRFPVKLTDKKLFMTILESNKPLTVMKGISQLVTGNLPGAHITPGERFVFDCDEPLYAQFDGEPLLLPKNVHIEIKHHERAFYALSTV